MLMMNYLQKFLFKWKYTILIISIILGPVAFVSSQINRWLPNYALSYSHLIAQQFHTKISFSTVHYRFPNYIIFKNINVHELDQKRPMFHASKMIMDFSFPFFSSATSLHYILINNLVIDVPVFKDYMSQHHKKISSWAKVLPQGSLRLLVPNGWLYLKGVSQGGPINFDIDLGIKQGHVTAHGFWGNHDRFSYALNGDTHPDGFDMDKLTLEDNKSSINLWGSWRDNNIDWKGYIFYNSFYILDIDGHLLIQKKDIILKQLSFSVDEDGVGARGHCSKQNLFQCDADITYWRGTQHVDSKRPLKNINLHLHAQNTPQGLVFNGWSDVNFVFNPDSPTAVQSAHLDFENLKTLMINGNSLKLRIVDSSPSLIINNRGQLPIKYRLPLKNLLASFNYERPYKRSITLSAKTFAGHCYSRIFLDTGILPWQIKSQGSFDGIKVSQGLLSGTYDFQSSKNIEISGNLALHNGNFNDTQLQRWMAKTLQMPSLDHVSNADLSCRFKINGKSKMLEDLRLKTENVDLSGFFDIDADNLISSQGSIRFSKNLLSESTIGRRIIGLVRGAWTLPFEFSLSGNLYRMNFQWDKSPLKDKVRQHLFSFFEEMIDRRMDARPAYKVTIPSESVSPG